MTDKKPSRTALLIAFATIYVVWGSTYLAMRVAIETMPPFAMAGVRFLVAGAILFTFLMLRGATWPTAAQWRHNAIVGTFLLLGGNGLVVWAEQFIASGIAALIVGVTPVFMVLAEWAWPRGHRPTRATVVGLALGFVGITWLAAPWENAASGGLNVPGVIALVAACCFWSIGSIFSRHTKQPASLFTGSAMQMLSGGAALFIAALVRDEFSGFAPANVSANSWGAFVYLILIGSLIGFSTFVWLMKHSTPARVATYAYVNPVVAVFLGWLLLDEPITPRTLIAAAIIVASVMIITTQKARKQPAAQPAELELKPRNASA